MVVNTKKVPPQRNISPAWIIDSKDEEPVILSTRARLARNLDHLPFPHLADNDALREVARRVSATIIDERATALRTFRTVDVSSLNDAQKASLVDSHLVSLLHVTSGAHRVALVDYEHSKSIMINEEDHIRVQTILPGLNPDLAWQEADIIDDALSRRLSLAYHDVYGYLTASLGNAGTGFRLSVMVHVPALAFLERLNATWNASRALGSTVRGIYGEGGDSHGHVYQVSNAYGLGMDERQIVGRIKSVAIFLQTEEEVARHILRTRRRDDIERLVDDGLERLERATALSTEQAMSILSDLRLGEVLGVKTNVSHRIFCEVMTSMRGSIGSIANTKNRARDVFYEDTRRPASLRTRLRKESAPSRANRRSGG